MSGNGKRILIVSATALVSSGTAVAINLATEWKTAPWVWVAVGVCTVLTGVLTFWSHRSENEQHAEHTPIHEGKITQDVKAKDKSKVNMVGKGTIDVSERRKHS